MSRLHRRRCDWKPPKGMIPREISEAAYWRLAGRIALRNGAQPETAAKREAMQKDRRSVPFITLTSRAERRQQRALVDRQGGVDGWLV